MCLNEADGREKEEGPQRMRSAEEASVLVGTQRMVLLTESSTMAEALGWLAVPKFRALIQELAAWRNKLLIGCIKLISTEKRHAVTVLEGQFDPIVLLQNMTHGIAGQYAQ